MISHFKNRFHNCNALRDLVTFAQYKKREKHPWRVLLLVKLQAKITLLHGCFSRFLNCTNGTKSRDASHMYFLCINPLDTVRKLNSHKAFRRRPKRFMEVLCTFNIRPVSRAVFTLCLYCVSINRNSRKACATIFGLRQRWAISERNAWRHYNKSDNPKVAHALWERRGKDTPGYWHVLWIALLKFWNYRVYSNHH